MQFLDSLKAWNRRAEAMWISLFCLPKRKRLKIISYFLSPLLSTNKKQNRYGSRAPSEGDEGEASTSHPSEGAALGVKKRCFEQRAAALCPSHRPSSSPSQQQQPPPPPAPPPPPPPPAAVFSLPPPASLPRAVGICVWGGDISEAEALAREEERQIFFNQHQQPRPAVVEAVAAAAPATLTAASAAQYDAGGEHDDVLDDHLWRWRFHRRWAAAQRGLVPSLGNNGSAGRVAAGTLLAEEAAGGRGGMAPRQASSGLFSMLCEDD